MAAALCVRAAKGKEGLLERKWGGEGEGEWGSGHKWPGRVSSELHARRGRGEGGREQLGGGYAGTTGLTARARDAERARERARAGKAGADRWGRTSSERGRRVRGRRPRRQAGPAAQREKGGERRARGVGRLGRKAEEGG
jgi:hypothetical protein